MENTSRFVTNFNQQSYYFKITIYNGDKNIEPIELDNFFIDQLVIEETLFNWYTTGYIILRNEFEFFERGAVQVNNSGTSTLKSLYTFRNDGRNKINIRIYPIFNEDSSTISVTAPEVWELNFDFVVYNAEDLPADNLNEKKKKLYLWEERYQHFLERNIQWSTYYVAETAYSKENPEYDTSNILADSSCKVGDAIKHIIQTACGETEISSSPVPLKVGWLSDTNTGSIKSPTLSVASFNEDEWDSGAEKNKITYTSPATYNVIDDINYLLPYFVSSKDVASSENLGVSGLLRLDRYSKKWSLLGIDQLFNKCTNGDSPGDDQIEHLYVQTVEENILGVKKVPNAQNVSIKGNVKYIDLNIGIPSNIFSYRFIGMSGVDDLNITNKPVVNYDNAQCLWNLYYKENTIENVKQISKQSFLNNKLYGSKLGVLIGINKDKISGINTMPSNVVTQGEFVKVLNRNEMLLSNLLLNQALEFDSIGLTIRTPGKFIAIDRDNNTSAEKNDFEDKFIGQWLLAKVTHNFNGNKYLTNTVSVKIHSFNELNAFKPENDSFNE